MLYHFCHPDAERSDAEGPIYFAFLTSLLFKPNSLVFVVLRACDFLHGATLLRAKAMLSPFCHPDAERSDAEGPMHFALITLPFVNRNDRRRRFGVPPAATFTKSHKL